MIQELGLRRWLAWRIVQVARRICDTEFEERITITDEHGQVGEFVVVGDEYGCGISSYCGPYARGKVFQFGACDVEWKAGGT